MDLRTRLSTWLARSLGPKWVLALATAACVLPAVLLARPLQYYHLKIDDFDYFASGRTWSRTVQEMWVPHGFHVSPVFRVWSWLLFALSGSWKNLPWVACGAAYSALVLLMLASYRVVSKESGSSAAGVAVMLVLGTSSVLHPAVLWYAANPTLWAGFGVVLALAAVQSWCDKAGAWRLAMALPAALLGVLSWSGGFVVGPVVAIYLWVDGRAKCRKAALATLGVTAIVVASLFAAKGRAILTAKHFAGRSAEQAFHPVNGAIYSLQGIAEAILLGNLGLESTTTAGQAAVLVVAVALVYWWTRRRARGITPLEAAAATLLGLSFFMAYSARGYLPFLSMRELRWYHVLPQIGAALFAAGWWSALRGRPRGAAPLTCRGALILLALAAALCTLHYPKVRSDYLGDVPAMTEPERKLFPIVSLQKLRANYLAEERAGRQQRFLDRLDRMEAAAKRMGVGRDSIVRAFGKIDCPDLPPWHNLFEIMDLPADGPEMDAEQIRQSLGGVVASEPIAQPPWLRETGGGESATQP